MFGAALNSRLSTWLLISGAKDLELVFEVSSLRTLSAFCHLPCHVLLEFCIAE